MPNTEKARKTWARVAGATYLILIGLFMGADHATRAIAGSGSYGEIAMRIAGALPLYRAILAINIVGAILTIVLAASLYAVLKPAGEGLARLALFFRLAEGFLEAFTCAAAFAIAWAYVQPFAGFDASQMPGLISLLRALQGNMFHIVTVFFGVGSTLFFILFVNSRAIPRALSVFGLLASLIVPVLGFAGLIVPDSATTLASAWYPIMVAELATGLWLLVFTVQKRTDHA